MASGVRKAAAAAASGAGGGVAGKWEGGMAGT